MGDNKVSIEDGPKDVSKQWPEETKEQHDFYKSVKHPKIKAELKSLGYRQKWMNQSRTILLEQLNQLDKQIEKMNQARAIISEHLKTKGDEDSDVSELLESLKELNIYGDETRECWAWMAKFFALVVICILLVYFTK